MPGGAGVANRGAKAKPRVLASQREADDPVPSPIPRADRREHRLRRKKAKESYRFMRDSGQTAVATVVALPGAIWHSLVTATRVRLDPPRHTHSDAGVAQG